MRRLRQWGCGMAGLCLVIAAMSQHAALGAEPIKVFILAGDEQALEQGVVDGRSGGVHQDFYAHAQPTAGEKVKHVNYAVYAGAYSAEADYERLEPVVRGEVEIGEQRTRPVEPGKRGREAVPFTPFADVAMSADHTTVVQGYLSVKRAGEYELHPGKDESAFNVTYFEDGREVYRREVGQKRATVKSVQLEPGKRYGFRTVFFGKPGHAFLLPMVNMPGTLDTAVAMNQRYAMLKDAHGRWIERDDAVLYEAHPIHNNTEAPAAPLRVGAVVPGPEGGLRMGVELMLGHRLGEALDEPVMLIRFATRHPIWFQRGSRSLGHDYLPPSSGGGDDLDGSWDVIHFNFGVWDATYRESTSKYFSGYNITSVEDFEKNLRTLVGKMKKTGATLIWASVTPVWEGQPGKLNADEDAFNKVAEKVMKENGVIINDLNVESRRMGYPKSNNVHSVGDLSAKVTQTILDALAAREQSTKPLPRVLLIGDSITGSYQGQVMKNFDGKAAVFKNPGNAEDTWNGLECIDEWLDVKRYLLCGQEYLELVDGIKKVLSVELDRAYPSHGGRGVELAGVVWFQGMADGTSGAMAAQYEKNLANLVRDLRKDLGVPNLPVVIAALGRSGAAMNANEQKVFDAQMALGDGQKYPEFVGNLKCIDTRPMCRPVDQSPGGRDRYLGNALSYLEMGDAMGRALLSLMSGDK